MTGGVPLDSYNLLTRKARSLEDSRVLLCVKQVAELAWLVLLPSLP